MALSCNQVTYKYVLWFKFIFGLKFFKPVLFSFPFVVDYDNEYETMKIKTHKLV